MARQDIAFTGFTTRTTARFNLNSTRIADTSVNPTFIDGGGTAYLVWVDLNAATDSLAIWLELGPGGTGADGPDFTTDFEANGTITVTVDTESYTFPLGNDTDEPYNWTVSGADATALDAAVTAFAGLSSPTGGTITLTLPEEPSAPGSVTVTPTLDGGEVTWTTPDDNDGPLTAIELEYREGTSGTWTQVHNLAVTATTYTITGQPSGTDHQVRVRGVNAVGDGAWRTKNFTTTQLPVADAPSVSINAVADGGGDTTVTLGATIAGGTYDGSPTYAWTVSGGTLDDATAAAPVWTRPTVTTDTDYDIDLTVTVAGNGTHARDGTSDSQAAATVTATVLLVLPVAAAPTVTINAVSAGAEGTMVTLGATLAGGTYDGEPMYAWTVSGGTLSSATAAAPLWTRPAVTSETDYTINLTVTVSGAGTNARDGTSDSQAAAAVTATVRVAFRTRAPTSQLFTSAPTDRAAAMKTTRICIDPGHGGSEPGAGGQHGPFLEKDIALSVGLKLATFLRGQGQQVLMTRVGDVSLSPNARGDIANNADCGVFVSIHCNAGGGQGFETIYAAAGSGNPILGTVDDKTLAASVNSAYARFFPDRTNRGIKHDRPPNTNYDGGLGVLRRTQMPACLIELEFIDDAAGYLFLSDDEIQDAMAEAIGRGILEFDGAERVEPDNYVAPRVPVTLNAPPPQPRLSAPVKGPQFLNLVWSAPNAATWELRYRIGSGEFTPWINAGTQTMSTIAVEPGQTVVVEVRATNTAGTSPTASQTFTIAQPDQSRVATTEREPLRVYLKDTAPTVTTLAESSRTSAPPVLQVQTADGLGDIARTVLVTMLDHITPPAYLEVIWPDGTAETFRVTGVNVNDDLDVTSLVGVGGSEAGAAEQVQLIRQYLRTNEAGLINAAGATEKLVRGSRVLRRAADWYRRVAPQLGAETARTFAELVETALGPARSAQDAAAILDRYGLVLDPVMRVLPMDAPQGMYRPPFIYQDSLRVSSPQHARTGRSAIERLPIWVEFDTVDGFDPTDVMVTGDVYEPGAIVTTEVDVQATDHPENPGVYRAGDLTSRVGSKQHRSLPGSDYLARGKAADYAEATVRLPLERLRLRFAGTRLTCRIPGDHNVLPGMRFDVPGQGDGWIVTAVQHQWDGDSVVLDDVAEWDTTVTAAAIPPLPVSPSATRTAQQIAAGSLGNEDDEGADEPGF